MPGEFFRKVVEVNLVGTLLVAAKAAAPRCSRTHRMPTASAA